MPIPTTIPGYPGAQPGAQVNPQGGPQGYQGYYPSPNDPTSFLGTAMTPGERNRFYELIQSMSPQDLERFITQSTYDDKTALNAADYSAGGKDANAEIPEGRRAGGTYVAAHPLEFAAATLRRGMGMKQEKGARAKQEAMIPEKQQFVRALLRALSGMKDAPSVPPGYEGDYYQDQE